MSSFVFNSKHEILKYEGRYTPGYRDTTALNDWCEENLDGYFSNCHDHHIGYTFWYFSDRKSAIRFVLTWT